MHQSLHRAKLFHGIAAKDIPQALKCLGFIEKHIPEGGAVFSTEEPYPAGVVVDGSIDLVLLRNTGRSLLLDRLVAGDSFICRMSEDKNLGMTAVRQSRIVFVNMETLFEPQKHHCIFRGRFLENLIRLQSDMLAFLYEKIALHTEPSLRAKILHYLRSPRTAACAELRDLDRRALADYLNCERSALSRELSRMARDGLVRLDGRSIRLNA